MKIRKILCALIALFAFVDAAFGAGFDLGQWIDRYNAFADQYGEATLSGDMMTDSDESGYYEFALSEKMCLSVASMAGSRIDGFLLEAYADDENARNVFSLALAAADENIAVESAMNAFDETARAFETDEDGEYAYYLFEGWMLIFYKDFDGKYACFTAIKEEVYRKAMGEEATKPGAADGPEDEGETPPEEKKDILPVQPESEDPQENGAIHKL